MNKRIWMLLADFYPGVAGAENQAKEVSKGLIANGWSVRVLTRRHGFTHLRGVPATESVEGIPVFRLFSRGVSKFGSLFYMLNGLWLLFRRGRKDIYHAHDIGAPGWLAVVARYLFGGRCVIKLRTGSEGYRIHTAAKIGRFKFFMLLRLTDRILVVNSEVEKLLDDWGIDCKKVVRVPNAVDSDWFRPPSQTEILDARERLGIPQDRNIVLYVGRLAPIKGLETLVRGWALLDNGVRNDSILLLVGDGLLRTSLTELIDKLGLGNSVQLLGSKEAVRDYYWASDIFVLPSLTEGMSNSLLEAMACGNVVVASNVGGNPDVIDDGINGTLFLPNDANDLMDKLGNAITSRAKWSTIGARARQTVVDNADLRNTLGNLDELYAELATG